MGAFVLKVVKTTEANADALRAIVDQAYGFPSRPATMRDGSPLRSIVPLTWNGTGPTPFGWTKSQYEEYRVSASDCWVPLEDDAAARIASSGAVSAGDKTTIANALPSRVDVPDPTEGGVRAPKASASVAVGAAEAETEKVP